MVTPMPLNPSYEKDPIQILSKNTNPPTPYEDWGLFYINISARFPLEKIKIIDLPLRFLQRAHT
jgi:hypothetical protein